MIKFKIMQKEFWWIVAPGLILLAVIALYTLARYFFGLGFWHGGELSRPDKIAGWFSAGLASMIVYFYLILLLLAPFYWWLSNNIPIILIAYLIPILTLSFVSIFPHGGRSNTGGIVYFSNRDVYLFPGMGLFSSLEKWVEPYDVSSKKKNTQQLIESFRRGGLDPDHVSKEEMLTISRDGTNLIVEVTRSGQAQTLESLLLKIDDPDKRKIIVNNLAEYALQDDLVEIFSVLLKHGLETLPANYHSDASYHSFHGSILNSALAHEAKGIVQLLIHEISSRHGLETLKDIALFAIHEKEAMLVQLCLKKGVSPNTINDQGEPLLYFLIRLQLDNPGFALQGTKKTAFLETARVLVANGANVDQSVKDGRSARDLAHQLARESSLSLKDFDPLF
jgi:hypothetical protein